MDCGAGSRSASRIRSCQDNIGDLWDKFTGLSQEPDEAFDEYKARVDHLYGLLTHAKDKPSAGLYAHRVLWKLSQRYGAAVLALKASGKLKDADKIDWDEIVAFINDHERSESRLNNDTEDRDGTIMAISHRGGYMTNVECTCFNCGHKGHMARDCKKPHRAHKEGASSSSDDSDSGCDVIDKRDFRHVHFKKNVKHGKRSNHKKDSNTRIVRTAAGQVNAIFKKELPYDHTEFSAWNRTYTADELDAMAENCGYYSKRQSQRGGHQGGSARP